MTFVQIIDCQTSRFDEMDRLLDTWAERTQGRRTATHATVGRDRSRSDHYVEIVEFPSYEEAMRNSKLPETNEIFEQMVALCTQPPTFTDLDVVRDEQLNKALARRFFDEAPSIDPARLGEIYADDYRDHDPMNEGDAFGLDALREELGMYRTAFDFRFTVEDQVAEGDRVATRWTWTGRHHGSFLGVEATGRDVVMTGTTTHRIRDGRIVEGWWNYDALGLARQIGSVPR
jgi:steroid delta-isomerase-like uncharacterized protein